MPDDQQQKPIDKASDAQLLDALERGSLEANETGISSQVFTALIAARNGNATTAQFVKEFRQRFAKKDAEAAALTAEIAALKAAAEQEKDTARVVAAADEIAKNGTAVKALKA